MRLRHLFFFLHPKKEGGLFNYSEAVRSLVFSSAWKLITENNKSAHSSKIQWSVTAATWRHRRNDRREIHARGEWVMQPPILSCRGGARDFPSSLSRNAEGCTRGLELFALAPRGRSTGSRHSCCAAASFVGGIEAHEDRTRATQNRRVSLILPGLAIAKGELTQHNFPKTRDFPRRKSNYALSCAADSVTDSFGHARVCFTHRDRRFRHLSRCGFIESRRYSIQHSCVR